MLYSPYSIENAIMPPCGVLRGCELYPIFGVYARKGVIARSAWKTIAESALP
jgi:hypothetical protein